MATLPDDISSLRALGPGCPAPWWKTWRSFTPSVRRFDAFKSSFWEVDVGGAWSLALNTSYRVYSKAAKKRAWPMMANASSVRADVSQNARGGMLCRHVWEMRRSVGVSGCQQRVRLGRRSHATRRMTWYASETRTYSAKACGSSSIFGRVSILFPIQLRKPSLFTAFLQTILFGAFTDFQCQPSSRTNTHTTHKRPFIE